MSQKFQRRVEDFTCFNCSFEVKGNGYTNHCPKCLWGKHVDVYPGDRASTCQGPMKPLRVEMEKGEYLIVHECQRCGLVTKFKAASDDDINGYLSLML